MATGPAGWCGGAVAAATVIALLAGCGPGRPAVPGQRRAAAAYLAIARAGNHRLETDFDLLDEKPAPGLRASRAALRDAAATERLFDRRLLGIRFPPAVEREAHALYVVNQLRAALTSRAARSATLAQLRGFSGELAEANVPVEQLVREIRRQLGLPPPETS